MKQKQQESSDWMVPMQPLIDIANINFKATQKFAELQSNFMAYLLDANLKQIKALVNSEDVKSAMERQLEFIKEVDIKWCDTAEQEIETTRDVQHSISGILENNIHIPDFLEPSDSDLSKH